MDSSPVPACRPLRNQANSVRRADQLPQSPKVAQSPRSNEPSQRDVISKDGHSNWPPFLSWSHFAVNCEVTLWRGPSRFQCASSKIVAEVCDPGPSTAGLREASHKRTAIAGASDPNDIVNCEMDHEGSAYFGGPIAICCGRRAEAQNPSSLGQRGGTGDGHPDCPSNPTTLRTRRPAFSRLDPPAIQSPVCVEYAAFSYFRCYQSQRKNEITSLKPMEAIEI